MLSLRSTSPASPPSAPSGRLAPRAPPPSGNNSPSTPSPRPPKSPLRTSTTASTTPVNHSHSHHRPGVTFGGTSVAVLPPKLSTDGEPSSKPAAARKRVQIAFAETSQYVSASIPAHFLADAPFAVYEQLPDLLVAFSPRASRPRDDPSCVCRTAVPLGYESRAGASAQALSFRDWRRAVSPWSRGDPPQGGKRTGSRDRHR